MSPVVTKSSPIVVRPLEPVTIDGTIKLSSFDKGLDKLPATVFLMFEQPIHEPAETIKKALSQALIHYYPFAGRIVAGADDDDEVQIHCNGEGVVFVAASASFAMEEVIFSDDQSPGASMLVDKLAVRYPDDRCGPTDPLLLMQVTEFTCSGFVIGATWNHAIADGAGMGQFLQAIGELARGLSSPSVIPVRWDDTVASIRASAPPAEQQLLQKFDLLEDLPILDITISSRLINQVTAEFSRRFNGQSCTKFDVVSAVIWKCRTRAIMSDPEAPALLLFAANVRKHVGAKQGYYGNCITSQLVMAKSGMVASGDITELVMMIKHSKEKIQEQFNNDPGSNMQQTIGQQQLLPQVGYSMLVMSSWRNLGFDMADFGSGRPAKVTSYIPEKLPFPCLVILPPCKGKDSAIIVSSATVKEDHADAFLGELARFM